MSNSGLLPSFNTRTKKDLMSLKGDKLLKHLRRESQMASKHTIATDLSVWNIDDA